MGRDARLNPFTKEGIGEPIVFDHRNRPLQEGDEILLNVPGPIFFRVLGIRPVLDPGAPPNLMLVDVAASVTFTTQREERAKVFIRVRTAEEAGPLPFMKLPDEPPPGDGA